MGGRQSSHNNDNHRSIATQQQQDGVGGNVRFSVSSVENGAERSTTSGSLDFAADQNGVNRRRRRRDRHNLIIETHSLPSHLFPSLLSAEIKCPVCNKRVGTDEIEGHLLVCLSKPRVSYNENVLTSTAGECIICFEDMIEGDHIARLPCLCIYHKNCLDNWFQRNRCCPEHPDQVPAQEFIQLEASTQSASNEAGASNSLATQNTQANLSDVPSTSPREINEHMNTEGEISNLSSVATNANDMATLNDRPSQQQHQRFTQNYQAVLVSHGRVMPVSQPLDIEQGEETFESSAISSSLQLNDISEVLSENSSYTDLDISHNNDQIESSLHQKTVVHVDDGSVHGSPGLFSDDDLAQLASNIKTILVVESPRSADGHIPT